MSRIRVLVVDDEAAARKGLKTLLAHDQEVEVIGESASGKEACEALQELKPDVVFLDIQMPDMDGFEVLATLASDELPFVVFVTAYDEYSLKAFDVHAVDYLLKPFSDERFFKAVSRAKEQCRQVEAEAFREKLQTLLLHLQEDRDNPKVLEMDTKAARSEPCLSRLAVGPRDNLQFVDVAKVRWIEAAGYRVQVHCDRSSFIMRGNIGSFEKQLNPNDFFRISRSAIVRLAHVRGLRTSFHDQSIVVLSDGTELNVSRGRRPALISLLERTRS
ncbi:MAG: response regulator transcription factor [bacterium]|nr:response regulator transcription factor [bacterium]